jgi:hypothetical protein
MAAGRSSWLLRSLVLALARRSLRRCLDASGPEGVAVLAAILSGRPRQPSS